MSGLRVVVGEDRIDPETALAAVGSDVDGAVLLFLGTVRNHNEGRAVSGLHYEAYPEMAESELHSILDEAARKFGTDRIAAFHRLGSLAIGDVSVAVAVSSPHRGQAFECGRWIMEELKVRLPIWKKEGYVEGGEAWVRGADPNVRHPASSGD